MADNNGVPRGMPVPVQRTPLFYIALYGSASFHRIALQRLCPVCSYALTCRTAPETCRPPRLREAVWPRRIFPRARGTAPTFLDFVTSRTVPETRLLFLVFRLCVEKFQKHRIGTETPRTHQLPLWAALCPVPLRGRPEFPDRVQTFTPSRSVRSRKAAMMRAVSGPGLPLPMERPSQTTIGMTSAAVPVRNASSALYTS